MIQLIYEKNNERKLMGEYPTDREARTAIVEYCDYKNFKSYYWNCYTLPEEDEYAGGTHIDFGSWSEFFIIYDNGL